MFVHFDSAGLAQDHLTRNGWTKGRGNVWLSADGSCRARIVPLQNTEVVGVSAWEV